MLKLFITNIFYAGHEPGTDVGPVISPEAKERINGIITRATERDGVELIIDGRNAVVPGYENGNFVGPTILNGVTTDMECYKEEMQSASKISHSHI